MRLVKNTGDNQLLSRAFDSVVGYIDDSLSSLTLVLGNEDTITLEGDHAVISLSRKNPFLTNGDIAGLQMLLLKALVSLRFRRYGLPDFIESVLADRAIIRFGFEDELASFYFSTLVGRKASTMEEYLFLNAWVAFRDEQDRSMLQDLVHGQTFSDKAQGLFLILQKNLSAATITEAVKEYHRLCEEFSCRQ